MEPSEITPEVRAYMASLGRRNKGKKKNFSEADLQRRREWARGLAAKRKAPSVVRGVV